MRANERACVSDYVSVCESERVRASVRTCECVCVCVSE